MALAADGHDADEVWSALWTTPGPPEQPDDRPSVIAALVSSLDGQVTEGGRVAELTGPADQRLLQRLRTAHDAVLVGATTIRVEGYASLLGQTEREQRVREGRTEQPLLCIISGRAEFDPDLPVLQAGDLAKVILTSARSSPRGIPATVGILRADANDAGELDLAPLLSELRAQYGIHRVLCEGGPTLIGSLVRDGLLDELFLTLAPRFSGGDGLRPLPTLGAKPRRLTLIAHAALDGYLFTRYGTAS